MKMTKMIKRVLVSLCCAVFGLMMGLIVCVNTSLTANADSVKTTDVMYCDGASIRLNADGYNGIRFHVRTKANEDGSVVLDGVTYTGEEFKALTTGILLIPSNKLAEGEELTIEGATTAYASGAKAANVTGDQCVWNFNSETESEVTSYYYEATAYIYNIPESNYENNFTFRGYYSVDGENYVYTEDVEQRSVAYVALMAKDDYQGEYTTQLNSFLPQRVAVNANFTRTSNYIYRVGNQNEVAFASLFTAKKVFNSDKEADLDLVVNAETVKGTATVNYDTDNFSFEGTGIVKITVTETYSRKAAELLLEVIDATNITSATGTTTGGTFVLLCDVNTSSYVNYWNCTVFGNGFTYSLKGAPTAYNSKQGHGILLTKNATLDNLKIVGDIYDEYGAYTNQTYYNAAIDIQGDTIIQNCYISGCSAPISARANVTITNSTLYGGAVANLIIKGGTAVLEDVTTVNYDDGRKLVGMGIVVHSDAAEGAKLVLNGTLTQYNFISESNTPTDSNAKTLHSTMFGSGCSQYHFGTSPNRFVNTGIISMTSKFNAANITDNANTGYAGKELTVSSTKGYVYTQPNTNGSVNNNYDEATDAHVATTQGAVAPLFAFDYENKNYVAKMEGSNDYCYLENDIVKISMDDGDTFEWDTSILTVTKGGQALDYTVSMNGVDYTGQSIAFNTAGNYEVVYTYTDSNNYGIVNGEITTYSKTYTKTVYISVAVIEPETKKAEFTMGSNNVATEKITVGNATYISAKGVDANNSTWTYITVDGQKIYYPIIAAKQTSTKGSSTIGYFPVFENAVTITDYADNGTGNAITYNSSTKTLPSTLTAVKGMYKAASEVTWSNLTNSNLTQSGASQIFKWASSSTAPSDPTTYNNVLCYKSPSISADRVAYITLVQYSYTDATNTTYYYYVGYTLQAFTKTTCVTPDTLVTLADGTQKEIQYVTYSDMLLVWDFYNGEYTAMPSSIVMNHGYGNYNVLSLTFDDGTVVNTINGHGFFDKDENKFVILDENNVMQYLGHNFVKEDVNTTTKLVSYSVREEYTESWSILTAGHYNCVMGGMLTITPAEVEGSTNYLMPFELGEDMKYDEAKLQADIDTYGLYTYVDFAEYMTYEQYEALNLANFKVAVGKGYITWDEILYLISIHIG